LVGERLEQADLLIGEEPHLVSTNLDVSNCRWLSRRAIIRC
jgi:hypothetical protein